MASLNDESDLIAPTDDLVEVPELDHDSPPLTIVTPLTPATSGTAIDQPARPLFPNDATLGEIPNIKAEFKLMSDQSQHLVDLKEVEGMLLNDKAVSQESAQLVDDYFGALFSTRLPKSSFTLLPSLTNYAYTLRHAQEAYGEQVAQFVDSYKLNTQQLQALLDNFLEHYEDNWDRIHQGRATLDTQYGEWIKQIQTCPHCVVPIHAETGESVDTTHPLFVNLLDYPIHQFNTNSLHLLASQQKGAFNDLEFYQTIHLLQHALRSMPLVSCILNRKQLDTIGLDILPDATTAQLLRDESKEITLRHIVEFYDEKPLTNVQRVLQERLSELHVVWFQNEIAELPDPQRDTVLVPQQYQQQETQYTTGLETLEAVADLMHRLMELNNCMVDVMHTLVYFIPKDD